MALIKHSVEAMVMEHEAVLRDQAHNESSVDVEYEAVVRA